MSAEIYSMPSRFRGEAEAQFPNFNANGTRDYRSWAKRIMYRVEHGDATVSVIQRQFATEALKAAVV